MNIHERPAAEEGLRTALIVSLREMRETLESQLVKLESHCGLEDAVYRFYHQSFKVYAIQAETVRTRARLASGSASIAM